MRLPTSAVARAGLTLCSTQQRSAFSHAVPVTCIMKVSMPTPTGRKSFPTQHTSRVFSTAMTPPPPQPSTPSRPPPSAAYSPTPSPTSTAPPASPSPKLPYTRRAADDVSETVLDPISASVEGEACPTILSQVEHTYTLPHPVWKPDQVVKVHPVHRITNSTLDTLAYYTIRTIRFNFDALSGWKWGIPNAEKVLTRCIFLESIAGVPGSVAGLLRHLASLRRMRRDYGWIHTLLEEAENERMHLLTFIQLKQPGPAFRGMVWLSQVIDGGFLDEWKTARAPEIALKYWKMDENATMRDLILVIRADEDHHREVNHCLADLDPQQLNPYKAGE